MCPIFKENVACGCSPDRWPCVALQRHLHAAHFSRKRAGYKRPGVRYSAHVRRISWQRAVVGLVVTLVALVAAGELPWRWGS
jgi:hypothetical protein